MKNIFISDIKNEDTELLCWVSNKRVYKNVVFLDLYDSTGVIQAVVYSDNPCFEESKHIHRESALKVFGKRNNDEFLVEKFKVLSDATLNISPSPNESGFNVFSKKYEKQVIEHPTFYIRNRQLRAVYYIKSVFKREIQNYFWNLGFVEFESPTLTKQTLYDDDGAIWLEAEYQHVCLSRCATFHLEPAITAYEKVFTITNSHADEKVKTNRHLVEYLHLKAELCWTDLEELKTLAAQMYYDVAVETCKKCEKELELIVSKEVIEKKLSTLNPKKHVQITYDEAVKLIQENGMDFEYGKSLTTKQEQFLTKHFDENFVWVNYIPYKVEGFMFKRKEDNDFLTMTSDLISPNGFGEILGCAEKMTNYDDVIKSMKQKGKEKDYSRYEDYALLHKYGLPEHGGIGMGIERALRYLLDIEHVKYVKPFAVVKGTQINH